MKTNKLLNPLSLFFVGLFLGALSRLFDMYYPNLGEILSQMSVWIRSEERRVGKECRL